MVHLGDPSQGREFFSRYGLDDVAQISDPDGQLYRAFGLRRAPPTEFFRWRTWVRGASIFARFGFGPMIGDGLRMPGVFLVERGEIVRAFRHESAEQVPDYLELAGCQLHEG